MGEEGGEDEIKPSHVSVKEITRILLPLETYSL